MRLSLIATAALLFSVSIAEASSIKLDFEGFPDLTTLTNQYPDLTFSNAVVLSSGLSLNEFEYPPNSGSNVVVDDGSAIKIEFGTPISSFGGYFTYASAVTLKAFGADSVELASITSAFNTNYIDDPDPSSIPNEFLQVVAFGIKSIIISGDVAGSSFALDDVVYARPTLPPPVPEPGISLLLVVSALAAATRHTHSLRS
jgi:hypothetical protein